MAADAANFIMPPLAALSTHKRQVIWQRSSPPCYLPTPFPGVGGERSETEGGGWMDHSVARGSKGSEGKVLKMDRPLAGGFLSLTGLWPEGCGIALSGDEYKVSATGLAFCVIWHNKHSGDWLTTFATPIRAAPDFHLKVKRLTMICASLALLQIIFAVHPRESVSHDSQVALLPYESCSLATPMQGAE